MTYAVRQGEYLHGLFSFIEENLAAEFDTELLSSIGYVSPPKLYRDIYCLTGHSVKEYVRKRRFSNALALIKASDMELTDIAYQCGYSSYLTLWRAIKQTLGLTPSEYKDGTTYFSFPPFSGRPVQSVTVSNETIPRTLRISFYHSRLTDIETLAVGTFIQACSDYNGRIFGRNGKQKENRFCYELYLTHTDADRGELDIPGFEVSEITPSLTSIFAKSTVIYDEPKINAAWDYLYSEWLQNSMFEYADQPYYEEYIFKNSKPVKLKLYLPIRKRAEDTKITLTANPGLRFITARAKGQDAEKIASQTVVDYITKRHPHIVKSSKDLYVRKEANAHICGVRIDPELRPAATDNISVTMTEHDNYLVLESSVMGDYDRRAETLLSFARTNGMDYPPDSAYLMQYYTHTI